MNAGASPANVYSSSITRTDNIKTALSFTVWTSEFARSRPRPFHTSGSRFYQDFLISACKELPSRLQVLVDQALVQCISCHATFPVFLRINQLGPVRSGRFQIFFSIFQWSTQLNTTTGDPPRESVGPRRYPLSHRCPCRPASVSSSCWLSLRGLGVAPGISLLSNQPQP